VSTPPPKIEPLIVPRAAKGRPASAPRGLIIAGLVIVTLILFLVFTARPGDRSLYPGAAGQPKITLFLVDNGFHSDIVVPRAALFAKPHPSALAAATATDKPWLVIGWGDANFYTDQGFTAARTLDGLRALLLPGNRSVVRIEGLARSPDQVYADGVRPITVTEAGLERLAGRIDRSLEMESDGQPERARPSGAPDVAFFKSVEHFSLLHLCNHWTADLLDAAGLPTTPVLDTLPTGLRLDLKLRAGVK